MSNQEVFNKVLAHLRKQGRAAMDDESTCVYRAPNGTSCAVGCLLPDNLYDPRIEGESVDALVWTRAGDFPAIAAFLERFDIDLLIDLQIAHDRRLADYGVAFWDQRMAGIAEEYGLVYTPPGAA